MSIDTQTIRACTMDGNTIREEIGDSGDLEQYLQGRLAHVYIIGDDADAARGYRVLADGVYDAAEDGETARQFARRMFELADERAAAA